MKSKHTACLQLCVAEPPSPPSLFAVADLATLAQASRHWSELPWPAEIRLVKGPWHSSGELLGRVTRKCSADYAKALLKRTERDESVEKLFRALLALAAVSHRSGSNREVLHGNGMLAKLASRSHLAADRRCRSALCLALVGLCVLHETSRHHMRDWVTLSDAEASQALRCLGGLSGAQPESVREQVASVLVSWGLKSRTCQTTRKLVAPMSGLFEELANGGLSDASRLTGLNGLRELLLAGVKQDVARRTLQVALEMAQCGAQGGRRVCLAYLRVAINRKQRSVPSDLAELGGLNIVARAIIDGGLGADEVCWAADLLHAMVDPACKMPAPQAAPDLCGALRVAVQQTAESDTAAMVKETALAVALTLLRGVHESARAVFAQHMRMADLPAYLGGLEQHIAAVERESQRPE
eukprot:TRINITY_DN22807_c0_g2_i2.p1 TRINITY_DN22807_c0_g2~~TRINITY_DN22807_c0_g2_i2.p1  ORF type:complete len:412 (-),score=75.69 TRINITY_DN22807_c0_g2_i2:519-1754(-)